MKGFIVLFGLIFSDAKTSFYESKCFKESDLVGFDAKSLAEPEVRDAEFLFHRQLVETDTEPYAFRVCYADTEIKSIQLQIQNSDTKDWLNVIGDQEYYKSNDCPVLRPQSIKNLVPIFISIGYTSKGVNFLNFVFAPSYDSIFDKSDQVDLKIGLETSDMEYENLAFSQQNAFIGFTGVTSQVGLPINQLGIVYFLCASDEDNKSDTTNSDNTDQNTEGNQQEDNNTNNVDDDQVEVNVRDFEPKQKDKKKDTTTDELLSLDTISDDSTNDSMVVPIVVGIIVAIVFLIIFTSLFLYLRRKKKVEKHARNQPQVENPPDLYPNRDSQGRLNLPNQDQIGQLQQNQPQQRRLQQQVVDQQNNQRGALPQAAANQNNQAQQPRGARGAEPSMRRAINNIRDILRRPVGVNEPARSQENNINNLPRVENARALGMPHQEGDLRRPVSRSSVGVQPQDM